MNNATTVWSVFPPPQPMTYTNIDTTLWSALKLPQFFAYTNIDTTVWPAPPTLQRSAYTKFGYSCTFWSKIKKQIALKNFNYLFLMQSK